VSRRAQVDWTFDPPSNTMLLAPGVEWGDPIVRCDVREDARIIARALRRDVRIEDARGHVETIKAAPL
jgi:hypothetical protein